MSGNTIGQNFSPYSSQFTSAATRIASANVASVKSKDDLKDAKPKEETSEHSEDSVMLSQQQGPTDAQKMQGAQQSGVMSELKKRQSKGEDLGELNMFGGEEQQAQRQVSGDPKTSTKEEKVDKAEAKEDVNNNPRLQKALNRSPEEIMKDVPPHFREIAKAKVKTDMSTKPASLQELEPPPEAALEELEPMLKPKEYIPIAPMAEPKVDPLPMEMDMQANV